MSSEPIEIKFENKEVLDKILKVAKQCDDLRPLMKNIAGIFASSTQDNFAEEGIPDKWVDLSEVTKNLRKEINKYPGPILQVTGQLATSVNTHYDNDSAVIGSNLAHAAIHQLGGDAGRNRKVKIPARPYLKLIDEDYAEIFDKVEKHLNTNSLKTS